MNTKIILVFFFCIFAMIMAKPWIQGPGKLIYLDNTLNCKCSKELNNPPPCKRSKESWVFLGE